MTCAHLWGLFSRILKRKRKTTQAGGSALTQTGLVCVTCGFVFSFCFSILWAYQDNCHLLKKSETFLRPKAEENQQLLIQPMSYRQQN